MSKMDRQSAILIIIITIFALLAALLATGAIPKVFDMVNVVNQTKYESINQTQMLVDFVTLYLKNMDSETKETVAELVAAKQSLENQEAILNENRNITDQILKMSQEHSNITNNNDVLQEKNDILTKKIDNITQLNYELLEKHTVNTTLEENK